MRLFRSPSATSSGRARLFGAVCAVAGLVAACTSTPEVEVSSTTEVGGSAGTGDSVDPTTSPSPTASSSATSSSTTSTVPTTTLPEDPTERWRVRLEEAGTELPGGGVEVFPDRRLVAFYGNPLTFRLGILGEYDPPGALAALAGFTQQYEAAPVPAPTTTLPPTSTTASSTTASSTPATAAATTAAPTTTAVLASPPVVPAFELIATVATAAAGDDGDYSRELTLDQLRPWVDAATDAGAFVILDLQPGRTDFLTQAQRYDEFLRRPNVGLALDPEWRLEADEEHLRQIGAVDAAEINQVVDYLVGIVHDEVLPQKILVLHQFRADMLPDRELVRTPPELAVVVHVDGQGPLPTKYATYETMLNAPIGPDQTLWWGWKNFYDEDFPMATPDQVNRVDPLPVIVTYQ